jgi:hypothetical protein
MPLDTNGSGIPTEGAPSLRFLQEPALSLSKGRVAMLPPQLFVLHKPPLRMRSRHPPFAKNAKERGTPLCW